MSWSDLLMLAILGIGSAIGAAAKATANAVFSAMASAMGAAAQWVFNNMLQAMNATTSVNLGASWFSGSANSPFVVMRGIAIAVGAPILIFGVLQSLLRNEPGEMLRRALLYPALAGIGTLVVVSVTSTLVSLTDAASNKILGSAGHDLGKFAPKLAALTTAAGGPVFAILLMAVVTMIVAFLIWLELIVRAGAIYVAVLFFPLGLVGLCWQAAAHTAKRLAEFLVAVILSKFVIAAVVATGAALLAAPLSGSKPGADISQVMGGIALLALAGFAPMALMRWIPLAEGAIVAQGHGRQALRGAQSGAKSLKSMAGGSAKSQASGIAQAPRAGGGSGSSGASGASGAAGGAAGGAAAAAATVAASAASRASQAGTSGVTATAAAPTGPPGGNGQPGTNGSPGPSAAGSATAPGPHARGARNV